MARVILAFRDRETWTLHRVGDEYTGPPSRIRELTDGGFLQGVADAEPSTGVALEAMTVAELRGECAKRGVEAPKRATKARLLEILGA